MGGVANATATPTSPKTDKAGSYPQRIEVEVLAGKTQVVTIDPQLSEGYTTVSWTLNVRNRLTIEYSVCWSDGAGVERMITAVDVGGRTFSGMVEALTAWHPPLIWDG